MHAQTSNKSFWWSKQKTVILQLISVVSSSPSTLFIFKISFKFGTHVQKTQIINNIIKLITSSWLQEVKVFGVSSLHLQFYLISDLSFYGFVISIHTSGDLQRNILLEFSNSYMCCDCTVNIGKVHVTHVFELFFKLTLLFHTCNFFNEF